MMFCEEVLGERIILLMTVLGPRESSYRLPGIYFNNIHHLSVLNVKCFAEAHLCKSVPPVTLSALFMLYHPTIVIYQGVDHYTKVCYWVSWTVRVVKIP